MTILGFRLGTFMVDKSFWYHSIALNSRISTNCYRTYCLFCCSIQKIYTSTKLLLVRTTVIAIICKSLGTFFAPYKEAHIGTLYNKILRQY